MKTPKKAVYFFCDNLEKDPVASRIYGISKQLFNLEESKVTVDGYPVLSFQDAAGNVFQYVRTNEVISHDYPHYLPILNQHFADYDFGGVVNWHEGQNAPEAILTVHTTGDVPSGEFGAANPVYMRNMLLAIEENRKIHGLDNFSTLTEATHWSGIPYGGSPTLVPQYPVPLVDIEIGSSPINWSNSEAAKVIAQSLPQVFERNDKNIRSLLCVGGCILRGSSPVPY